MGVLILIIVNGGEVKMWNILPIGLSMSYWSFGLGSVWKRRCEEGYGLDLPPGTS